MSSKQRKPNVTVVASEESKALERLVGSEDYIFRHSFNSIQGITNRFGTEQVFLQEKIKKGESVVAAISKTSQEHLTESVGRKVLELAYNAHVWGDTPPYIYAENWTLTDRIVETFVKRASASVIADLSGYCLHMASHEEPCRYTSKKYPRDLKKRIRALMIAKTLVESQDEDRPCIPNQVVRKLSNLIEYHADETGQVKRAAKELHELIMKKNLVFEPLKHGRQEKKAKRPDRQMKSHKGQQLVT